MVNLVINADTKRKYGTALGTIADSKPTSRSSTGVRGVYKVWYKDLYQARIQINGKEIILITTPDFEEAVNVRKEAEETYYKPIVDRAINNGDFIA